MKKEYNKPILRKMGNMINITLGGVGSKNEPGAGKRDKKPKPKK